MPVGVHRLPEQHHLGVSAAHERLHLGDDVVGIAAHLGPSRPWHHAEAADVVATLHRGHVGADLAGVGDRSGGHVEAVRLAVEIHPSPASGPRAREQLGHAGNVVGADQDVHVGRAREHVRAVELGHAPADANQELRSRATSLLQAAEGVIQLLRRPLAHRAGVDEDEVGVVLRGGGLVPFRLEQAAYLLGSR